MKQVGLLVLAILMTGCWANDESPDSAHPELPSPSQSASEPVAMERVHNCRFMEIPPDAATNASVDRGRETVELTGNKPNGVAATFVIRYTRDARCMQNPDTMRVITQVLREAHMPVPMPMPQDYGDCPKGHEVPGPKYYYVSCSPPLKPGVRYTLFLTTSCGSLPDFDGSFWALDPEQAKKHSRHLDGHHGLDVTVVMHGDRATFRKGRITIELTRQGKGLAYISCA